MPDRRAEKFSGLAAQTKTNDYKYRNLNLNIKKGANEMDSSRIRKSILVCIILFLTVFFPFMTVRADDQKAPDEQKAPEPAKPSVTLSTDILSQYIFRGAAQSKSSAVIQPSVTVTYLGFSANFWGNFDTSRNSNNPLLVMPSDQVGNPKWSETDFTFSYTRELCKDFSFVIGDVYYGMQNPLNKYDLNEIFAGVTYNFPWFSTAFTAYREVTHNPGLWLQLDLTKSIPLAMICEGASLDLGASFGYLILNRASTTTLDLQGDTGYYSDFHTAQLTAGLKIPVCKLVTISPKVGLWLPLTNDAENYLQANSVDSKATHFYGGINATASF
jgi:hypothetical protein